MTAREDYHFDTTKRPRNRMLTMVLKEKDKATLNDSSEKVKKRRNVKSAATTSIEVPSIKPTTSKKSTTKVVEESRLSSIDRNLIVSEIISKIIPQGDRKNNGFYGSDFPDEEGADSKHDELLNGVVRIYCTHSVPNFGSYHFI
jgi:hypothetical protein